MRRQSKAQIIGREGERWFQSILPPEWTIQRPFDDFGTDAIVAVGDIKRVTSYEFGVQIKSSQAFRRSSQKVIIPRISKEAIVYWSRKFYPTLIVAYDTKKKIGYYDWVSNMIAQEDFNAEKAHFHLRIPTSKKLNADNCADIAHDLRMFHGQFVSAFHTKAVILPIAASLSALLRNICTSKVRDQSDEQQVRLSCVVQAWTHEEVIRELDKLLPTVEPQSIAWQGLSRFRQDYFKKCELLIHDFAKTYKITDVHWMLVKKPPESDAINAQLAAMLSECVSGLLHHAQNA